MAEKTAVADAAENERAPRVVILGGGFAGLEAARLLGRARLDLTVVDRQNHHCFQPLLYQVATAGLSGPDIAAPIRKLLRRHPRTRVIMAEATAIDLVRRRVTLADGELEYDYHIVALGASHSYFGRDDWADVAPGLKTIEDAVEIRRRILLAYEAAERETHPKRRQEWLTFAIVGAGPTGVELAGALAELSRMTVARDFRNFKPSDARIVLLDAADRVLPGMPPDLSEKAARQLLAMGIEIHTHARVTGIDESGVTLESERIAARTVIWSAGVRATPVNRSLGAALDRQGRAPVNPDLSLEGHPEVFVCGDAAAMMSAGKPVPGVAPAAMQAGRCAARNVLADLRGRPREAFVYRDRGVLATIGRKAAVGEVRGWHVSGFVAWLLWLTIHVFYLLTFRNRLVVMFEWAWAYFTFNRSARVIVATSKTRGKPAPVPLPAAPARPPAASAEKV
jgi:NADH dehydrogenase